MSIFCGTFDAWYHVQCIDVEISFVRSLRLVTCKSFIMLNILLQWNVCCFVMSTFRNLNRS